MVFLVPMRLQQVDGNLDSTGDLIPLPVLVTSCGNQISVLTVIALWTRTVTQSPVDTVMSVPITLQTNPSALLAVSSPATKAANMKTIPLGNGNRRLSSSSKPLSVEKQKWLNWCYDYGREIRDTLPPGEEREKLTNLLAGLVLVDSE
jgi:hypothetical protein